MTNLKPTLKPVDADADKALRATENGVFRIEHAVIVLEHAPVLILGASAAHEGFARAAVMFGSYTAVALIIYLTVVAILTHFGVEKPARLTGRVAKKVGGAK